MVNLNDIPLDHVDPNQAFDPLPTAWYAMRAVASEQKPTKAGDGAYLQYELEIDENHHPELKGRKVWDRFNLWNPNSQAVEIAQRQLKAFILACGKTSVNDSSELHGITVQVKVTVRPASGQYDASNEVKGYRAMAGSPAPGAAPAAATPRPQPTAAGASGKPPWAK